MADVTDAHGVSLGSNLGGVTDEYGFRFEPNVKVKVKKVTKHASCTATRAILLNASGATILENVSFSGNDATFAGTTEFDAAVKFVIKAGSNGAGYAIQYGGSGGYPVTGTNVDYTDKAVGVGTTTTFDTVNWVNIVSVTTEEVTTTNITSTPSALNISTAEPTQTIRLSMNALALAGSLTLVTPTIIGTNYLFTHTTNGTGGLGTQWIYADRPTPIKDDILTNYDYGKVKHPRSY